MDSQSTEERAEKAIIALTPEQLKDICANAAEIGAKEALKTYEQERKKEQGKRADRRLRNTKLLLRNYHMLKEHAENSVFGRTQMEESAFDILESMMNLYDNEEVANRLQPNTTSYRKRDCGKAQYVKGKCVFRFESCRGKTDCSYIRGGRIESTIKPPSTK